MFLFENGDFTNFRLFLNFIEEYFLNPLILSHEIKIYDQEKKQRDEYGRLDR